MPHEVGHEYRRRVPGHLMLRVPKNQVGRPSKNIDSGVDILPTNLKGDTTMKYNLSMLMKKAWSLFKAAAKKTAITFGEALRKAWAWLKVQESNKAIVEAAAAAAGYADEVVHTWAGWQALGRMVMHTSEAVFQVVVADPTTKKGTRIQSFFTYEQTQHMPAE